eukprot:10997160-Alexandrium_andersonii.AAC.1
MPFHRQLAEAVFAKNAWLAIGEGTPYKALFGRAPATFRDFDQSGAQVVDDDEGRGAEGLAARAAAARDLVGQH